MPRSENQFVSVGPEVADTKDTVPSALKSTFRLLIAAASPAALVALRATLKEARPAGRKPFVPPGSAVERMLVVCAPFARLAPPSHSM